MQVTTESLENRQLRLTIQVDEERTRQAMQHAARQVARQVNIPGFRKGKAPYEVVVQRYGEDTIRREAAETLVETVFRQALEQENIEPYAPGDLEEIELDPLTFTFTLFLPPTVDLGDYRDYRLKSHQVKVYKKEVEQALEEIREQNVILEPVERPVALDDAVVTDLWIRTLDGVTLLKEKDVRILLTTKSTTPALGFAEAVVGMEAGDERTFTLTLPDDFPQKDMQGQEAEFTVKVTEVYDSTLPDLDDDLARTVGNYDSFKELENQVKEQLRQTAQREADQEYADQALREILDLAQVEYPPVMIEETLDDMVEEFEQAVQRETRLSLEDYLRFQNQTLEEARQDMEPRAAVRLKRALVLGKVVDVEKLEVTPDEVEARIDEISASWGEQAHQIRKNLRSDQAWDSLHSRLLAEKAVNRLVAIAQGEAPDLNALDEQNSEEAENTGESDGPNSA